MKTRETFIVIMIGVLLLLFLGWTVFQSVKAIGKQQDHKNKEIQRVIEDF